MNRLTGIGLEEEEPALDVSDVVPEQRAVAPARASVREIAVTEGFRGRTQQRPQYTRITGRTEQFNVRLTSATRAEIYAIADEYRWGIGETVEKLVEAFRARPESGENR